MKAAGPGHHWSEAGTKRRCHWDTGERMIERKGLAGVFVAQRKSSAGSESVVAVVLRREGVVPVFERANLEGSGIFWAQKVQDDLGCSARAVHCHHHIHPALAARWELSFGV